MNPLLEFSTKSIAYKDRGLLIFCAPRSQLRAELHEVCFVALQRAELKISADLVLDLFARSAWIVIFDRLPETIGRHRSARNSYKVGRIYRSERDFFESPSIWAIRTSKIPEINLGDVVTGSVTRDTAIHLLMHSRSEPAFPSAVSFLA